MARYKAPQFLCALANTNAGRTLKAYVQKAGGTEKIRVIDEIKAIMLSCERERFAKFPRTTQDRVGRCEQLSAPNKNCRGLAFLTRDNIEAVVHPINEINIAVPRRPKHDGRTWRFPAKSMRGWVISATVCFCFGDACLVLTRNDYLPQKLLSDAYNGLAKK